MVDFSSAASKKYVLVSLDFPNGEAAKAKVPNPKRNAELQQKYNIHGFPTVLLMTADGKTFGQMGYQPGGAKNWLASLESVATSREIAAAAASAKDPAEKAAVYEKAIAALSALKPGAAGAGGLVAVVGEAYGNEKSDLALRLRAAQAMVAAGFASDAVLASASKLDPKNEAGFFEKSLFARMQQPLYGLDDIKSAVQDVDALVAVGGAKDKKIAKHLYSLTMLYAASRLKDPDKAKAYAKRVQELGFGDDDQQLKAQVDRILSQ